MTSLNSMDNENIYELLSKYRFKLTNENVDNFKCIICGNILINACQAFCGCHFCRNCADMQLRDGDTMCPGITEECKISNLSNVAPDHKMNRQICQLVVKCPEETCSYECPINIMKEHLRFCPKEIVTCPFNNVGCDKGQMGVDKLKEHLQLDSSHHSQILIDIIGNLRNEMAELRCNAEKNDSDIESLKKRNSEKAVIIASMNDDLQLMNASIQSIKLQKTILERRVKNLLDILDERMNRRDAAQRVDNAEEGHEEVVVEDMSGTLDEMRQDSGDAIQLTVVPTEDGNRMGAANEGLPVKIDRPFVWTIDGISEKREVNILSEYFHGCAEQFQMQLRYFWSDYDNQVWILLRICAGESDANLQWPFDRNVTIGITNETTPNVRKSITSRCTMTKPENDSYKSSDYFIFAHIDLFRERLLLSNRLTVECIVHDE